MNSLLCAAHPTPRTVTMVQLPRPLRPVLALAAAVLLASCSSSPSSGTSDVKASTLGPVPSSKFASITAMTRSDILSRFDVPLTPQLLKCSPVSDLIGYRWALCSFDLLETEEDILVRVWFLPDTPATELSVGQVELGRTVILTREQLSTRLDQLSYATPTECATGEPVIVVPEDGIACTLTDGTTLTLSVENDRLAIAER